LKGENGSRTFLNTSNDHQSPLEWSIYLRGIELPIAVYFQRKSCTFGPRLGGIGGDTELLD
jgi:hypothetical protein